MKSGQTDIEVATLRWDGETAQSRIGHPHGGLLDGSYRSTRCSRRTTASRAASSTAIDGYTVGDEWPIISGQDAELDSVKAINSGEQYATIFKDTRELATVAVDMATALLTARSPRSTTPRTTTTA